MASGGGTNYWTSSGGNIYNNTGTNVGIGQSSPGQKLDVNGTAKMTNAIISQNMTVSTGGSGDLSDWDSGTTPEVFVTGNGTTGTQIGFNVASGPILFGNFANPGADLAGFSVPGSVFSAGQ